MTCPARAIRVKSTPVVAPHSALDTTAAWEELLHRPTTWGLRSVAHAHYDAEARLRQRARAGETAPPPRGTPESRSVETHVSTPPQTPHPFRLGSCPPAGGASASPDTVRVVTTVKASLWGWTALGATIVSAVGYATQTALDYVSKPDIVGQLVFYGLFGGFAIAALVTGIVAVVTGRHRRDHTVRLGLVAIGYVALAQTIQSLWD